MDYTMKILMLIQFFFTVVIGLYFWNMLKKQQGSKKAVNRVSSKEMNKLRQLRRISLTEPLAEKTRPEGFADIIGQKEGITALKAALCGPNPQHVIIYGRPGVGKTAAARLVMEAACRNPRSPFTDKSKFVEIDATIARFDERSIADPLIGSVHDPIYQGAGPLGVAGIPQPKPGAVTRAHGGMLFIDEIGELHPLQLNKLLKVLEDRRVYLDSAYYSEEDDHIPSYIHDIFQNGLPADFRLVGATTRSPAEIPPAIRSRCLEVFFRDLKPSEIREIAARAVARINFDIDDQALDLMKKFAKNGREAVNMVQLAGGMALKDKRKQIKLADIEQVLESGQYAPRPDRKVPEKPQVGVVNGLAVQGANSGMLLEIEAAVLKVKAGRGQLKITGVIEEEELGERGHLFRRKSQVRESAVNALTVLKRMIGRNLDDYDIHINFPGGIPIDGPSAGVAMAVAVYSALIDKPVNNLVALTGELSIRGMIKPVGGVGPKISAARQAGARVVLIPEENWQSIFADFQNIRIIRIKTLSQAIKYIIDKNGLNLLFSDQGEEKIDLARNV